MVYGRERPKTKNFIPNCFHDKVLSVAFFFLQKSYYKLQLALNYWKTCIAMTKEKRKRKRKEG